MNEKYEYDYVEEGNGKAAVKVIKLLFGNPRIFVIAAVAAFVVCVISVSIYSGLVKEYEGFFMYKGVGLSNETVGGGENVSAYLDGSKFDVRDLITLEKLEKYKAENEELSSLDMSALYNGGNIKSFEYEVVYKEIPAAVSGQETPAVQGTAGYKLVMGTKGISLEQARVLARAIANEPVAVTKSIISQTKYNNYLTLFDGALNYEDKVDYLTSQLELLQNRYNYIIGRYGDMYLPNGYYGAEDPAYYLQDVRISDSLLMMNEYFQSHSLTSMRNELVLNGYIQDSGIVQYTKILQNERDTLNRELALATAKLTSLVALRNDLVDRSLGTTLQTAELASYNTEIVALSNSIEDIKDKIELNGIMLNNLDTAGRSEQYVANVAAFDLRLEESAAKLREFTTLYTEIERYVCKTNCSVYYESNSVIKTVDKIGIIYVVAFGIAAAIIVPVILNIGIAIARTVSKKEDAEAEKKE